MEDGGGTAPARWTYLRLVQDLTQWGVRFVPTQPNAANNWSYYHPSFPRAREERFEEMTYGPGKETLNRLLVHALEGMGDAYRAALLEEETEDDMPQDEIEWARSGERGVKAQGGSPPHTKKRGSRACSHLRRSGGLSPATGAAQLCYQQRREQVVSQHHDIGGGASYGTAHKGDGHEDESHPPAL